MTLALIVWFVLTVIPNLLILIKGLLIIWGILTVTAFCFIPIWWDEIDDKISAFKKLPIKSLLILPIFLWMIIPDKHTSYAILAAYGVESIVTNDKVQEFGSKSLDVLEKAMEDYLKEGVESLPVPKLDDKVKPESSNNQEQISSSKSNSQSI